VDAAFAGIWVRDDDPAMRVGGLRLRDDDLELRDAIDSGVARVSLGQIRSVCIVDADEDLGDVKTVLVQLAGGGQLRVAALGSGATLELGARLHACVPGRPGR
jgi:hypothetical protein